MSIKACENDLREVLNRKVAYSRLQDSGKGRSKNIPGKFEKRSCSNIDVPPKGHVSLSAGTIDHGFDWLD